VQLKFDKRTRRLKLKTGRSNLHLSADATAELIRGVVDLAHDVKRLAPVGDALLTADLDYSDVDGDQDTLTYSWAVTSPDRAMLVRICPQVTLELGLAGFHSRAILPVVPELQFKLRDQSRVADAAGALRSLRHALMAHQSDSVVDHPTYWQDLGLSCFNELSLERDDDGHLDLEASGEMPDSARAWLERWADGASMAELLARMIPHATKAHKP